MIIDRQRLKYKTKKTHVSKKRLTCNRKQKWTKKRTKTQLTQTEKLIYSN